MNSTITAWIWWMRAAGTPETTINLRRYYLLRLHRDHSRLLDLDVDQLAEWIGSQGWAPNTRKSVRSALRSFYAWAVHTSRLSASPAHLLPAVRIPRSRPKPAPELAYRKALDVDDERIRLAVRLAGQCGLRRGELAKVHSDHVEDDLCGYSLRVTGKGGHVRIVPLPDDLAADLLAVAGWGFPSPRGGHLTPHHLAKMIRGALEDDWCTHSLRHRAATAAYAGTKDLRAVQEMLGHSRPETTAGYVQIPNDDIRRAVLAAAA